MEQQRKLRRGYTTGSCATAASMGAALCLLGGQKPEEIPLTMPNGERWMIPVDHWKVEKNKVTCAVRKDGGDDPDVTHGALICATVERCSEGVQILGGPGVGRVMLPGLECPVGAPAINRVPRQMITEGLIKVREQLHCGTGLCTTIWVPQGEELAKKTYNPRLGIVGGISILGTTGIVEPMSEQALLDTIRVEIRMKRALGYPVLVLTPGNYGEDFLKEHTTIQLDAAVKCSNFIGPAVDMAVEEGFSQILLVGHVGKLVKVAAGIMNTHSRWADGRREIFGAYSALCGAEQTAIEKIMESTTTDQCLEVLEEINLKEPVMEHITCEIEKQLQHRAGEGIAIGAMVFSNRWGLLGKSPSVEGLMQRLAQKGTTE